MEKSKLKKIIKEVLEEEGFTSANQIKKIKDYPNIQKDDVGTFWIVAEAGPKSTIDDIFFEVDLVGFSNQIKGGLPFEEIIGIYKNKSEAKRLADETILNAQRGLKEIEDSMNDFRKNKSELEEKKKLLADKIKKIKK